MEACFTSVLASSVTSLEPNATPIFFRKSLGGVPPAKIQTKSLGISRVWPFTCRTTLSGLNSTGAELKSTVSFPERTSSSTRLELRSLMRLNWLCR